MPEKGEATKPLGRSAESLGWLASSGVVPKRRKEIHGVSAASLVAMKAQLARTQQEAAAGREGRLDPEELRARRRGGLALLERGRNAGVEARDAADRQELRTSAQRLGDSRAALERKAALYDKLERGEAEDEDERYEVDFALKPPLDTAGIAAGSGGGLLSGDMAQERRRRDWERDEEAALARRQALEERREEERQMIEEIVRETEEERARAAEAKQSRAEADARKREKLKAAFMRKQLQQLQAAKAASQGGKQRRQQGGNAGDERQGGGGKQQQGPS
eukprot:scaffold10.g2345.t1